MKGRDLVRLVRVHIMVEGEEERFGVADEGSC
jgi:hypothetical protein